MSEMKVLIFCSDDAEDHRVLLGEYASDDILCGDIRPRDVNKLVDDVVIGGSGDWKRGREW